MKLKNAFLIALIPALLITLVLPAQTVQLNLTSAAGCNFDGSPGKSGPLYGFDSSREAETAVQDILRQVGLPQNFRIKAANVPNAQAHISGGERYILYSQQFMDDIHHKTGDYWSKIAVLAHEIGHHLLGHTLKDDGSRPLKELDADQWSGFVLHKMGATLVQAQLAAEALTSEQGSATHPPRNARLEAIAVGYQEARELAGETPTARPDHSTPPRTETKESKTPDTSPATADNQVALGGKTYRTVSKNGLTWMAENLDYQTADSWCYEDDPVNCFTYGRLYTWEAANQACRKIGWRLPTDEEWGALIASSGGYKKGYRALKNSSTSGFAEWLGGMRNKQGGGYHNVRSAGYYWSATEQSAESAWFYFFDHTIGGRLKRNPNDKTAGFSCRCVRD